MKLIIDISGNTYNRLTVIKYSGRINDRPAWLCKCSCGKEVIARGDHLKSNLIKSCGCLRNENLDTSTHNKTKSPEYRTWLRIKTRCYDPTDINYYNYGGRGIKVCDRWLNSFENFYEDIGPRPSKIHTLDRFPNNATGNYEPTNCRWATPAEQSRNTRRNIWFEYNGEKMILLDWAKKFKLKSCTNLKRQINKNGISAAYKFYMAKLSIQQ